MTWAKLLEELHSALKTAPDFAHTEEDLANILLADENGLDAFDYEAEPGVRAAIRMFAREREWPDLTEAEQTCLRYRLSIACDYVAFLMEAEKTKGLGVTMPTLDEEDLVEWITCGAWEKSGYPILRDLIESYARGRAGAPDEDVEDLIDIDEDEEEDD